MIVAQSVIGGLCGMAAAYGLLLWLRDKGGTSHSRRTFEWIVPIDEPGALELCRHAAKKLGAVIVREGHVEKSVTALTGMNWRTFGDRLDFRVEPSETATKINVMASQRVSTSVWDWGQNRLLLSHIGRVFEVANARVA